MVRSKLEVRCFIEKDGVPMIDQTEVEPSLMKAWQQHTVVKLLSRRDLGPGKYNLQIKVRDKNRTIMPTADFEVH